MPENDKYCVNPRTWRTVMARLKVITGVEAEPGCQATLEAAAAAAKPDASVFDPSVQERFSTP
jgi:hypothetical protein